MSESWAMKGWTPRAMRFVTTPDTWDRVDAAGRKMTWVLPDPEYPPQPDEPGQPGPRRTDVIIDPEYCRARERGESPGRRTLLGETHQVVGQIGEDALVVAGLGHDFRVAAPVVVARLSTGEVLAAIAWEELTAREPVTAVRLSQEEVDRALRMVGA